LIQQQERIMQDTTQGSSNPLKSIFLDHPASVDETYFEHMRFALRFAFWLTLAGMAALVHAFIPAACEKTASNITRRLYARIENRGN
jgi:hypothetical protein